MSDELIAAMSELVALGRTPNTLATTKKTKLKVGFERFRPDELHQSIEIATRTSLMRDAFEEWAAAQGLESASFAVIRRGGVGGTAAYGNDSARTRNEFASCSKLITGLAMAQLVRAGKLTWDTTMEQIFGRLFRIGQRHLRELQLVRDPGRLNLPDRFRTVEPDRVKDEAVFELKPTPVAGRITTRSVIVPIFVEFPEWFRKLTVTEVITHHSGIRGEIGEHDPYQITLDERFGRIVMSEPEGKHYVYENNNYVVLGIIIERLTGKSFRDAVLDLVLKPLRISDFDADNRGPYAGCWLSAANYARMLRYLDADLGLLGDFGPATWPRRGDYSVGTHSAGAGTTFQTWHSGYWIWNGVSFGGYHQYWHDVRTGYFVRVAPGSADYGPLSARLREIATDPSIRDFDFTPFAEQLRKAGNGS